MKIAQVAPLIESVPPDLYGGTERIVSYLTEELVDQGHEVALFASGDSVTSGELVACCAEALRLDRRAQNPLPHHVLMLEQVRQRAPEFDIIHFHLDHLHLPLSRALPATSMTTLHSRLDLSDVAGLYDEFDDVPLVSISAPQRQPFPDACWVGTVHHGLPPDLYAFSEESQGYLAFLGRLSPEKRPDRAIAMAAAAGLPLKMAAKVNDFEQGYVDSLEPLLEQPHVDFIGEIADAAKSSFLGGAKALLFPIDWPEPFGLAMIEAMACGTPVIAWRSGAVPDVVEQGVTGFIVDSMEEAVKAIGQLDRLDRTTIRRRFEERFTVERMARDYVRIYQQLVGRPLLQVVSGRIERKDATATKR